MEPLETPTATPPPLNSTASAPPGDGLRAMSGKDISAPSLASPGIKVEFHGEDGRLPLVSRVLSAPAVPQFQSPMRQHKRTPSQHREVKETLNARSEYTNDETDGRSQLLINQYTIKEEIGRGSYGAVHLAVDQYGGEYAVKEFSKTRLRKRAQSNILRRGPQRPGRFPPRGGMGPDPVVSNRLSDQKRGEAEDALFLIREEIAIMKKLNHPNLVSLIEVLDDPEEDSLYMVLEMCKKGVIMKVGLDDVADPYPEEECRCWFRDLILGIEYLHAQGVVHRDIKPDNLLLTEDDVLKIVDFGVSEMFEKPEPEKMRTAKSAGSPAFLPPELCVAKHGDVSGTAADIWSMGVSLYCLRYGHIPFNQPGVLEIYDSIKTETPKLPEDENELFVDVITRLMEKDPEKRIKMSELREHSWVTKQGADPLLSAEDNCSEIVEPPNELEVNHAFTRRMSHLLCVMKAIHKFKTLIFSKSRLNSPKMYLEPNIPERAEVDDATPTWTRAGSEDDAIKRANKEHAASLLEQRMQVLSTMEGSGFPGNKQRRNEDSEAGIGKGHARDPTDHEPIVLGIGTGNRLEFVDGETPASVVADSPTAVDFNVYDKAYEEEVERIKRSGGQETMYMTWQLGEKDKFKGDEDVIEGMKTLSLEEKSSVGGLFKQNKFADLVAKTIQDTKSKVEGAVAQQEGTSKDDATET